MAILLLVRQRQYVAGLALKYAAHLLERVEIHTESLAFLQTPQRCMADTGLFCQPIERSALLCQYLIYSNFNNKARPPQSLLFIAY
jgi:hypothetical protein